MISISTTCDRRNISRSDSRCSIFNSNPDARITPTQRGAGVPRRCCVPSRRNSCHVLGSGARADSSFFFLFLFSYLYLVSVRRASGKKATVNRSTATTRPPRSVPIENLSVRVSSGATKVRPYEFSKSAPPIRYIALVEVRKCESATTRKTGSIARRAISLLAPASLRQLARIATGQLTDGARRSRYWSRPKVSGA